MTDSRKSARKSREFKTIDLNLLKVFETLMEVRNVSLAAARLNVTQPSVSNSLNRLRAYFEDDLFVRTRNGMEPTQLAQALADPILQGLASIRAGVAQNLSFDPATSDRRFTIITTDVGEATFIVELLRVLRHEAPNIDLRVLEIAQQDYERLLDNGEADFALGLFKIADTFNRELIGTCRYVALMCKEHAARIGVANGEVIPHDVYMEAAHVHVVPRRAIGHPIEPALGADAARRRVALELPHTAVLSALLPETELVATIPEPAVSPLMAGGRLSWAVLPFAVEPTRLYMGWHKRHDNDGGHAWMRQIIRGLEIG
mgnify:CR=1 FL=1